MKREEIIKHRYELLAPKMLKALEQRGYEAYFCKNSEETKEKVLSLIPCGSSVTWGGSMSLDEIGIKEALKQADYVVLDRDTLKTEEKRLAMMRQAFTSDVFLSSVNAISEDGEMINIDGTGNRIAAIAFGPKTVILVVGMNKVCEDLDSARKRARNVAAPNNGLRLKLELACTKTGSCADCQSTSSMCSQIVEMRRNRIPGRIKVILVGEDLGL